MIRGTFLKCLLIAVVVYLNVSQADSLSTAFNCCTSRSSTVIKHLSSRGCERNSSRVFASSRCPKFATPALQMTVEGDFSTETIEKNVQGIKDGSMKAYLRALYKFCRPHTIRGTIFASIAGTIRALLDTPGAICEWLFVFCFISDSSE